jgi:uncharacterized protein with von Willebrand factor type A (vWA) domain
VHRGFGINLIKAIATNERVYSAFARRGFRDQHEIDDLAANVENYAQRIELPL